MAIFDYDAIINEAKDKTDPEAIVTEAKDKTDDEVLDALAEACNNMKIMLDENTKQKVVESNDKKHFIKETCLHILSIIDDI